MLAFNQLFAAGVKDNDKNFVQSESNQKLNVLDDEQISANHLSFFSQNQGDHRHLWGLESSENGAEEDDDKAHKKLSLFSEFLKSLNLLRHISIGEDPHIGKEVFNSHIFKSSSFKSLFLVLEVFRL